MRVTVKIAAETNELKFKPGTVVEDVVRAVDAPLNSTVMRDGDILQLDDEVFAGDTVRITPSAKAGAGR